MSQVVSSTILDDHVAYLREWLVIKGSMPDWSSVLVTEVVHISAKQPVSIVGGVLFDLDAYRGRFLSLVNRGWPWINLTALGLLSGTLILGVETPKTEPTGSVTSLNYSGPIGAVAERRFVMDDIIHFL